MFWVDRMMGWRGWPRGTHLAPRLDLDLEDLAPKLARIRARVDLREARNTNSSSSIIDDVPMDGLVLLG